MVGISVVPVLILMRAVSIARHHLRLLACFVLAALLLAEISWASPPASPPESLEQMIDSAEWIVVGKAVGEVSAGQPSGLNLQVSEVLKGKRRAREFAKPIRLEWAGFWTQLVAVNDTSPTYGLFKLAKHACLGQKDWGVIVDNVSSENLWFLARYDPETNRAGPAGTGRGNWPARPLILEEGIRALLQGKKPDDFFYLINLKGGYLYLGQEDWKSAVSRFETNPDPLVVSKLIGALTDPNRMIREAAAELLEKRVELLPRIERLPEHPDPDIDEARRRVLVTLRGKRLRESGDLDDELPELVASLNAKDPEVRKEAARLLSWVGPEGRSAVPALVEALKDDEPGVRCAAASALGAIGGKDAVAALAQALRDRDNHVQFSAGLALQRLSKEAQPAVPALIEALKDEDETIRWGAVHLLFLIGPSAKEAVPALHEVIQTDNSAQVRAAARQALDAIQGESGESSPQ
jgi:HEAT repeat protein